MRSEDVPQDDNPTLGGHRKAVYARDAQGRIVPVASQGWEVETIVTTQAVAALDALAEAARSEVLAGRASTLWYWMHARRMDLPLLAQVTGLWQWQVRRHLKQAFDRLPARLRERYAEALGLPLAQLDTCPPTGATSPDATSPT